MHVDPDRLRALRERQGWSRDALEQKTKGKAGNDGERLPPVTAKTIQRHEEGKVRRPHARTVRSLAKALDVNPAVLSGEAPMPESAPSRDSGPSIQINALIRSEYRLAYGLVRERYGVTAKALIETAPLFFALLAEGSLKWRREKLAEAREAIGRLEAQHDPAGRLPFGDAAWRAEEIADAEQASIEKGDVFGREIPEAAYDDVNFDPDDANPFTDYLKNLEGEIGVPDQIAIGDTLGIGGLDDFPDYELCVGDLDRITTGSDRARYALRHGHARLANIPKELRGEEAAAARVGWLEGRVPDEEWEELTSLFVPLDDVCEGAAT